ncbi:hypothetical protein PRZ48_002580 [Zasmidium cellare]|uniref:Uncharacterized protein n=1 Tax=Zasmidium cellare TaxID=395010 RepID=A0ABR0ESL9_ZASCE|nr:hypothetical protein PRZ48_002580 [Zasmidium cellare]
MAPTNKINDLFNVNGLVAVITGGGSGLGLYAARALDANGAKAVYIVGRREQSLKDAAATGVNGKIIPIVGDVTDKESLKKVVDHVQKEQGYINLLFANSGVSGPNDNKIITKPDGTKPTVQEFADHVGSPSLDDFNKTLSTNVTGVFHTVIAFLPLLDAGNKKKNLAQDSQILITSSVAGFSRYLASSFAYSTSKAAVNHLCKMLATTFAQQGFHIRANVVAPGLYPSEMTQSATGKLEKFDAVDGAWGDARVMAKERAPAERTGSEEDFAATILFFASRAGAYLNGETLVTDGGRLAQMPAVY